MTLSLPARPCRTNTRRRLFLEPLESRNLMAIDLGITLAVTDQANGTTSPGNVIANGVDLTLGTDFLLVATVDDLRNAPTDPGVLQAYLDLTFPTFSGTPGAVTINSAIFPSGNQTGTLVAGQLTEVGAGGNTTTTDPTWLFVIPFTGDTAGLLNFTANLDTATGSILRLADNVAADEFTITNDAITILPDINAITDPAAVNEDAAAFNVGISGIDGGVGGTVGITAQAANTSLVSTSVTYTPGNPTGTIVVTPVANAFGSTVVTVSATVNGAVRTRTFNVVVNAVNDDPQILATSGTASYVENTGDVAAIIDPAFTVTDVDSADFSGGTLTVTITNNGVAEDRLEIAQGNGITTSSGDLSFNGNIFAGYTGGTGTTPLVITFTNANATLSAIEQLAQNLTFRTISDTPSVNDRTVTFVVTDGDGGTSAIASRTVSVVATNDDPVLTLSNEVVSYTENTAAVFVAPTSTVTDVDSADFDTGTLVIAVVNSEGDETIAINNEGVAAGQIGVNGSNITFGGTTIGTFSDGVGAPLNITFNSSATPAAVQALVRNITFQVTGDVATPVARQLNFILTDGDGGSDLDTKSVAVVSINDVSVMTISGTPAVFIEGGADQLIAATSTLTDPDAGDFAGGTLTVEFTANGSVDDRLEFIEEGTAAGQIGLSGSNVTFGGTTFATVAGGQGTTPLVFTFDTNSNAAAVQQLLRRLSFSNVSDAPSVLQRAIRITFVDGDGTALGGQDTVIGNTTATVTAVNDPPVVTLSTEAVSYTENGAAVVIANAATLTNPDSADYDTGSLSVTLASSTVDDRLEIRNQGTNAGQIGFNGANVTFGGTTIGTFTGGSGTTSLVITFNASATNAAVQALLSNITFRNVSDNPTTTARNVQFVLDDGDGTANGGSATDTDTKQVTVVAVNDAPNLTLAAAALAYNESAAATVIDATATVTDVDSANFDTGTLTVAFQTNGAAEDRLEIRNQGTTAGQIGVSGSNVTFGGTTIGTFVGGTGTTPLVITFNASATVAAVEALAKNITYRNVSDAPSTLARTVRFTLVDGDGTANGGADTDTADKTINVTAVNDAPVVTLATAAASYTENAAAIIIDSTATVTDADSTNFDTGSLTVSFFANGTADDRLAIRNEGSTAGLIGVSGSNVTFGGTTIGTFTGGTGTTALAITLNANATAAATQALIRNITYSNVSDNPSTAQRTVRFVLVDGDGTANGGADTDTDDKLLSVVAVNDAPVQTLSTETVTWTEGQDPAIINATGTLTDVDSPDFGGGTLTVSVTNAVTADDRIEIRNQGSGAGQISVNGSNVLFAGDTIGSFTGGVGTTPLVITFNTSAFVARVQALMQNITFRSVSTTPSVTTRTITFAVNDGDGGTDSDTKQVGLVATNSAPIITLSTETVTFTENGAAVVINATGTVVDNDSPDFNTGVLTISISANASADDRLTIRNQGTGSGQIGVNGSNITFGGTTIGTFSGGTGTTPLTVTLNASANANNVQTLLRNVLYSNVSENPTTDTRTISVTLADGDGATNQAVTKSIAVTAVNDAPVNTIPGAQSIPFNGTRVFNTANNNRISISDIDVGSNNLEISLNVTNGTLSLSGVTGLTFTTGTGTNNSAMTFRGTLANVNAALDGLTFTPTSSFAGNAIITLTTSDLGNTGGTAATDSDTITIGVGNSSTGSVYIDSNGNGVRDTGEVGIPNVTVTILGLDSGNSSINRSVTTNSNGDFTFTALPGGRFRFTQTANSNFTTAGSLISEITTIAGQDTTGLSFRSSGLRPELITINHFLASTPAASTLVTTFAPATGQTLRLAKSTLTAARPASSNTNATSLTTKQAEQAVYAATSRLLAAAGTKAPALAAKLSSVQVQVADLGGDKLALTQPGLITFDINAAGQGWFIDATPDADEEFTSTTNGLLAHTPAAKDRVDLLTVATHELGHLFGLEDEAVTSPTDESADLMAETLLPGVRKGIDIQALDAIFAGL